jgi:hypothetical protein
LQKKLNPKLSNIPKVLQWKLKQFDLGQEKSLLRKCFSFFFVFWLGLRTCKDLRQLPWPNSNIPASKRVLIQARLSLIQKYWIGLECCSIFKLAGKWLMPKNRKIIKEVPPRLELGLLDSESNVLTTRPWDRYVRIILF